jgi:SAM-dependent MidA family methyltransferase
VEWLRTYRDHARGGDHLEALGTQDITCEVAVDQLATIRPPKSNQSQQDWLESWGIEDLVAEGQRIWTAQASNPNVAALAARSRTPEAAALTDPKGLGAFRVLEWHSRN